MLYGLCVLTSAQDRVSGECNFSPLSNCKQAFNYKLAVLTALGETKPHSVLKLNPEGSVFQKQICLFLPAAIHIYACATHVAFNYQTPKFCIEISEI